MENNPKRQYLLRILLYYFFFNLQKVHIVIAFRIMIKLRTKFTKRRELIFEKNAKTRQTVFKVNSCFKVLFNLFRSLLICLFFLCNPYLKLDFHNPEK
jgi:hypothetical protein